MNKYILLVVLWCTSCTETKVVDVMEDQPVEQPSSVHYYYSFKAAEVIGANTLGYTDDEFTPGCTFIYGDTLFIANTRSGHYSVELYSLARHEKIGTLNKWTYEGVTQTFNGEVEGISVSRGRLYLAGKGSSIDVFDVQTLQFVTRIGNRNWGSNNYQLFHAHALAIVGNYVIVRMKNGLQVHLQTDVTAANYQKVPYYSRGSTVGFDMNNGFNSHQMTVDSTGIVFLADYGQYGNRKIQVIDTARIVRGTNVEMTDERTIQLDFNPRGIALYKQFMYISAADGSIRFYDRDKQAFIQTCRAVSGYTFKGAQKLYVNGNRLWVTDVNTKEVVGVDIYQGEIEEYDM